MKSYFLSSNLTLKSKLYIPPISEIVERTRLHPLFRKIQKHRLVLVTAGAGYGKSTFVAEAVRNLGIKTVWYRLDSTDRDFIVILNYLIEGLRQHFPDFGQRIYRLLINPDISSLGREIFLKTFILELESAVKNELIIVIDDFHLVQGNKEIKEAIEFLIECLPPEVHLVIISRTNPEFAVSTYRAKREILEIQENDLAFSLPETEQLFSQVCRVDLSNTDLKTLHQKTGGWISGLILFYNSLKEKKRENIDVLLLNLKGTQRMLSDFLEENVYKNQSNKIKVFLKKTSILSRLDPAFCDELLGIDDSRRILHKLLKKHLFTFPLDEEQECFCYHHLFQDYLYSRLQADYDKESIFGLQATAAGMWEERGRIENAIHHYLKAQAYAKACSLLRNFGKTAIAEGRIYLILSLIEQIPDDYLNREPWIQYTYGRTLELLGKRQLAPDIYTKALTAFTSQNQTKGVEVCLSALGLNFYMAERYFKEALSFIPHLKKRDVLAWLYFNQGFRHCFAGNFKEAVDYGEQVEEICARQELHYTRVFNYHLLSWSYFYLGLFAEGIENAEKGLLLMERGGYQDTSYAWLLIDYALNSIGQGNPIEAIDRTKTAIRIFQEQGSVWGESWAYHILFDAYKADGRAGEAEEFVKLGIGLLQNIPLPLQEGMLKLRLAELNLERKQWNITSLLLKECENAFKNSKLYLTGVCFLWARFFWQRDERTRAVEHALKGLRISEANQYDIWVAAQKDWIIPLLAQVYEQNELRGYIKKILYLIGPQGLKDLLQIQKKKKGPQKDIYSGIISEIYVLPSPDLRVQCFGEFKLFKGNEEIKQQQWKSKKALQLFKYLMYHRSHGYIHKDVLIELVWPEVSPSKTSSRLHDALSALRQILEPERKGTAKSSYLLRDKSSYKLFLGDNGSIDAEEFSEIIEQAGLKTDLEESMNLYFQAEMLYRGDFLEEERYVDWCSEERERLKNKYLQLLEEIMSYFEKRHHYEKCIEYAVKYVKVDKYNEYIYQRLMRYYANTGKKSLISATFETCRKSILEGFDTPISSETELLYQELLSG
ncbi:MAG: hypothetical protein HY787_01480 [Deltaproteobacteria bacterium]|nr:hypothetical protein [Deltaproteobacteria bacterium]